MNMKVFSAKKVAQNYKWDYFYCAVRTYIKNSFVQNIMSTCSGRSSCSSPIYYKFSFRLLWCRKTKMGQCWTEPLIRMYCITKCLDPYRLWGWIRTRRCVVWGKALFIRRQWWKIMTGVEFCPEKERRLGF